MGISKIGLSQTEREYGQGGKSGIWERKSSEVEYLIAGVPDCRRPSHNLIKGLYYAWLTMLAVYTLFRVSSVGRVFTAEV